MNVPLLERPRLLDRDSPLVVAAPHHVAAAVDRRRRSDPASPLLLEPPPPLLAHDETGRLVEVPEHVRRLPTVERSRWLRLLGLVPAVGGGDAVTAEVCGRVDIAAGTAVSGTTEAAISTSPPYAGSGSGSGGTGGYWYPLKVVEVILRGVATTGGTAGTLILNWRLDSITGASLGASATLTLLASQTNVTWEFRGDIVCRSVGTSGTLWGQGLFVCNSALIAANLQTVPASAPATATIDTTANHTIVVTALLSQAGSSLTTQQALWRARN